MSKPKGNKRLDWLNQKMRTGNLTKQEQMELGRHFLPSTLDPTRDKHQ